MRKQLRPIAISVAVASVVLAAAMPVGAAGGKGGNSVFYVFSSVSSPDSSTQVTVTQKATPPASQVAVNGGETCTKGADPNFCDGSYKDYRRAAAGAPWYPTT